MPDQAVEQIKFKWRLNSENKNPVSIQSCLYSIKAMTALVGWLSQSGVWENLSQFV